MTSRSPEGICLDHLKKPQRGSVHLSGVHAHRKYRNRRQRQEMYAPKPEDTKRFYSGMRKYLPLNSDIQAYIFPVKVPADWRDRPPVQEAPDNFVKRAN